MSSQKPEKNKKETGLDLSQVPKKLQKFITNKGPKDAD